MHWCCICDISYIPIYHNVISIWWQRKLQHKFMICIFYQRRYLVQVMKCWLNALNVFVRHVCSFMLCKHNYLEICKKNYIYILLNVAYFVQFVALWTFWKENVLYTQLQYLYKVIFEIKLTFEMLTVRGQQHSFSTHERMFLWKYQSFWDRKYLAPRGTRAPNLQIHAEIFNLLSYQGQTFAVPCFWTLALVV